MIKKLSYLISVLFILQCFPLASTATQSDGEFVVADFSSGTEYMLWSKKAGSIGLVDSTAIHRGGGHSAKWSDTKVVTWVNSPQLSVTDWSGFQYLNLWVYSANATNATVNVILYSGVSSIYFRTTVTVNWTGWQCLSLQLEKFSKNNNPDYGYITSVRFDATGWGVIASDQTELYFDKIWATRYKSEDFMAAKNNWRRFLAGSDTIDTTNDKIISRTLTISNKGASLQKSMIQSPDNATLWGTESITTTKQMTAYYNNIYQMALAYSVQGGSLYRNVGLRETIIYALDWMYEHLYGYHEIASAGWKKTTEYNWHDWQVMSPRHLINTLMLMEAELTYEKITQYLSLFNKLVPNVNLDKSVTKGYNVVGAALLQEDAARLIAARDAVLNIFQYMDSGEGFYTDGSYINHTAQAYNGHYGCSMLQNITPIRVILNNTKFEMTNPVINYQIQWIYDSFEPILYRGEAMSMVCGRRPNPSSHSQGFEIIQSMIQMMSFVTGEDANRIKSIIKYHVSEDTTRNYYAGLSLNQIEILESIMNDDNIEGKKYIQNKVYHNMDKVVHHRPDFCVAISMSSSRIFNYESINNTNVKGWYTGDGMVYMYNNDLTQYETDFWDKVNPYHMPGTTVDTQTREAVSISQSNSYLSGKDFVGGVSDGEFGVAAMWLESYHYEGSDNPYTSEYGGTAPAHNCSLEAQKSWFMFDDEVVALGAGIVAHDGFAVETVIENRKIQSPALTVDDEVLCCNNSTQTVKNDAAWAHLGGVGGYYFPSGENINIKNTNASPNFLEMWVDHGENPQNDTYAYVILPNKTALQTKAYAQNADIAVLANSNQVQAVQEKSLGAEGVVFWQAGSFKQYMASEPMMIYTRNADGIFRVSVSDPTQKLSMASLNIDMPGLTLIKSDAPITVRQTENATSLDIDFNDSKGQTYSAAFTIDDKAYIKTWWQNENKEILNHMPTEGNVVAAVWAQNNSGMEQTIMCMIGVYDKNESLSSVVMQKQSILSGYVANIFLPVAADSTKIFKLYVWDIKNISPLTNLSILQ